jgi:hypothetical protein
MGLIPSARQNIPRQPLAFDPTPGYLDTAPLPTRWKYRGIYRVGDNPVGDNPVGICSNEVNIIVGG